ncbi:MAG: RagB/SusD family nutrient uptake outer membrane protein, partial [Sphingobacteriales bacterium]
IANDPKIIATDQQKITAEAEAKFLRANSYFFLVRTYGRVPLIDKIQEVTSNIPQSTPAQIYAFIESDLATAVANLPAQWDKEFVGRATKGMANGMLAKVYLYQQKWGSAMAAANAVMTSGLYDLSTPYAKIFSEDGENSKEAVFEIQATAAPGVAAGTLGIQYTSMQGVRGTGIWNLGWGWNMPSAALEAAYEPNDPRKARTILYTSQSGFVGTTIHGETTPVGLPNTKYNHKRHSNPSYRARYNSQSGWWMNVPILRYADVVLMYAEAANELGGAANIALARTALNSVRARARQGAPAGTLPDITSPDQTVVRDAIRQERRVELAMEHERFFDIVRWGIDAAAMQAAGKTGYNPNRDRLMPIPQQQIDLSKGVLTQNPFYN